MISLLNAGAAMGCVALGVWLAIGLAQAPADSRTVRPPRLEARVVEREGERGLLDASGHFVPLVDYHRVVGASLVADQLLLALSEPARVLAYSKHADKAHRAYRFTGKARVELEDIEALVALRPDLVLVSGFVSADRAAQLRAAGLTVFQLGPMHGLTTLLPNLHTVATLLGRPQQGRDLARQLSRRMSSLSRTVPPAQRPTAIYIGIHGDKLYGGTRGSSYHDVLTAAGLVDAAAARHRGWPRYTSEQLLALDPDIVVTQTGMGQVLCRHIGLDALRACQTARIVEAPTALLSDPGLSMLEAAETIAQQVGHLAATATSARPMAARPPANPHR